MRIVRANSALSGDREEIYLTVIEELRQYADEGLKSIADEAGVCTDTLYRWKRFAVFSPRLNTLFAVARALGFEVRLVKAKGAKRKLHVVK